MSLLFDRQLSVDAACSFSDSGSDTVLIGRNLWQTLGPLDNTFVCLSIQPLHKSSAQQAGLASLTCWAVLDEATVDLVIPSSWCTTYSRIFSQGYCAVPSLSITKADPLLLTEVIVTALSARAYQVASGQNSVLETWLTKEHTILRHGAVHTFSSHQLPVNGHSPSTSPEILSYRMDMVEPVLQGFARKGSTRFILTLSDNASEPTATVETAAEDEVEDEDVIEIDEAFLANSVPPSLFGTSEHTYRSVNGMNGSASHNGSIDMQETAVPELSFRIQPLSRPIDMAEDHYTLYLRTADLGRIGILHGDWAMARSLGTSKCRLVKIVANDNLVTVPGLVTGSPTLLHNLCSDYAGACPREPHLISLHSSPFGSRQPAVPMAQTVTVARVASPISTNRIYQHLFLNSLKAYFDSAKRLVKQGDVIAVSLDTNDVNHLQESNDKDEGGDNNDSAEHKLAAFRSGPNETVFFCITNVEHDVIKNDSNPDVYLGSTIGELGCWVDSTVTRMIQTGLEHSWIPYVGTYFDTAIPRALFSTLSNLRFSHLLGRESPFDKLFTLASAACAQHAVDYQLDLSIMLSGARGTGKFTTTFWVAQRLGMHLLEVDCYDVVGENDTKTEGTLRSRFDKAKTCAPCVLVLRHVEALAQTTQVLESGKEPAIANALQECIEDVQKSWKITGYPVVTIGTTSEPARVPASVSASLKHEIFFEAPGEGERYEILTCSLVDSVLAPDVSISSLAIQTAALVASDLVDLVARAKFAAIERVTEGIASGCYARQLTQAGLALSAADFDVALGKARASYSESIGAPKIPSVSWDDVGGLAHVKSDILDTIQLPLEHPELFADGLKKRSGILLYGPPGTGKTLIAKAVATSCSLNFFSIKGPELLNMYIGESEANVRRVFQRARDAKPCVIFFDELDSVAPKRGNQGDSGGVMDRIVSQLLAELDGMSAGKGGADVFVIGATNRPDLLDPALLRPGRFDRMLYLGVSETHQAQANILEALTRRFRLHPALDLRAVAEQCPFNYTGADFYALCSDAMLNAMSRKAEAVEEKIACLNQLPVLNHPYPLTPQYFLAEMASADDINVLVSREDFDHALRSLIPSVSQSEMDHYSHIQRRFSREE
ncbi:Peroxisomal biogenesis factor 6 [Hypsizygus marmoreus]|uniref:Peroxisomal ATPase PEX6 n=1 Tax=Hypsizygus marmoreus TaxID=39966 RepID=A0A369JQ09_HYPMA|nr:Peroxisomal biogenesis factor 6 [Hypsizygus marmoreus]